MQAGARRKRAVRLATVAVVLIPILATVSLAQDAAQVEKDANEIYNSLLSPFCPGRLISNCPSPQAADLRSQIREQLEAGVSKESVIDELYATWGEEVLGGRRGPVSYGVPIGVILVSGGLLVLWLRGTSRRPAVQAAPTKQLDSESEKRLQEEMAGL